MAKILTLPDECRQQTAGETRDEISPCAEIIVFPRMSLKYLLQISEAMGQGRNRSNVREKATP
jgi:hypothetical protein